jgi:hypothetical protein
VGLFSSLNGSLVPKLLRADKMTAAGGGGAVGGEGGREIERQGERDRGAGRKCVCERGTGRESV